MKNLAQQSLIQRLARLAKAVLLSLAAAGHHTGAHAAELPVTSASEIAATAAIAEPGDVLVMRDGVWQDADILFIANGTASAPVTLRAETLGGVHLTGQSRIRIAGQFGVVDGLVFTNGYRASGDVIAFQDSGSALVATQSRITNCAIISYNPPDGTVDTKWVSLYGFSNRVDHCYFAGKENVGATLTVWVDARPDRPNYHQITKNIFGRRPPLGPNGSNGGETIRVGTSDVSLNLSRTTVEDNYFEQCSGDAEIVSSKSCENVFRRNTFVECEGVLSIRHGNRAVVEGNYFFGRSKPLTGGIRVVGEDHKVYNNYFQDLTGTSSRAPLSVMQGLENTPLNGYAQVHRAVVVFNTFVNCSTPIVVGLSGTLSGTTNVTTLPPVDCVMANNLVVQASGRIIDQRITPVNLRWEANIFFGGTLGITTNAGTLRVNPQLAVAADNLWRPTATSPALNGAQGDYDFVATDMEGNSRTGFKDIGCDEASASPGPHVPRNSSSTGPLWMRTSGTFLAWTPPQAITYGTPLTSAQLNASANAAGTLAYDPPAGTILHVGQRQVLTVVFTPHDQENYTMATQSVTIDVLLRQPTVGWTNPEAITYGTLLSGVQLNATASVPGTFTYLPPNGFKLNAGMHTLRAIFTPQESENYAVVTNTVTLTVRKAAPGLAWNTPAPIEHGTALGAAQLNATANVPGLFSYQPAAGTVLAPGSGHTLTVTFTPLDSVNHEGATASVTMNVRVGGKTVPTITWAAPAPILAGAPLSPLQLNASSSVPGTITYSPALGTILPAGNGQVLTATFHPYDTATYTGAVKTVQLDVAAQAAKALLRVAYLVPTNRFPQSRAIPNLQAIVRRYQQFFRAEMERNGYGPKTFTYETEPNGSTPLIHVVTVPTYDALLRGDINGTRVMEAARAAGLPIEAAGQIWWLVAETHVQRTDGGISGGMEGGFSFPTSPLASGWMISSSDDLALYRDDYQTNSLPYDGLIIPEIGSHPLIQDVSFPWFEGVTVSGISSSAIGSGLRSLGQALGLQTDYRNDENFDGNLMGFGFRGIRGVFHPQKYPYNDCRLSYAAALVLNVSPFFNPGVPIIDSNAPSATVTTSGAQTTQGGLLHISFAAADDRALHAATLAWQTDSEWVLAAEAALSGNETSWTFVIPYFASQQTNRYLVTVYDQQGNRRVAQTTIYPSAAVNHSPQPFVRVSPSTTGLGEDVVLDASASFDPDHAGGLLEVEWDLDGDGFFDTLPSTDLVYTANFLTLGTRLIRARLTDPSGDIAVSAPVAVSIMPCQTALSPTNRLHGYGYSTGAVTVTTGTKCHWEAINTNDWIKIISDSLVGPGRLTYYTEPNPEFRERWGTLVIGDQVYTVGQQAAICTYSVSPTVRYHGYGSGTGSFKVSTKTNCTWAASTSTPWITLLVAEGTNTGNGTYFYGENRTGSRRSGTIEVNEQIYTVTQWGTNCEAVISPTERTHSEVAEVGSVAVNTASGCTWQVVNTNSWISVIPPDAGVGSGSFSYAVAPNPHPTPRSGTLLVNDQVFVITQKVCSFSLASQTRAHGFLSETGTVIVQAGGICEWNVINTNDWISIASGERGMGTGTVTYVTAENLRGVPREGKLTIAGLNFTVTQPGKLCAYMLDPTALSHGEDSDIGQIEVLADSGCLWTVQNTAPWVTILSEMSGEGPGTVLYAVDPNPGPGRSTTLSIGTQDFNISQASGIRNVTADSTAIASESMGTLSYVLDARGTENNLAFSLCFDTNYLRFHSATLAFGAPAGASLSVHSNAAVAGHVGFGVTMPPGWSMPAGTSLVVQASFEAKLIEGNTMTTVSACDYPRTRQLGDALGRMLAVNIASPSVRIVGFCSLAEALDAQAWSWTNSTAGWNCQTNTAHDGEDAAESGAIPDGGQTYFESTFIGPGRLSFWWKVSSEPANDRLRLLLDGTEQFRISGEVDWQWRTFDVPPGSHVLRWHYSKNGSITGGRDRGWVDEITYQAAPPSITSQPTGLTVDSGSTASFSVTAAGFPPLAYQWLHGGVALADGAGVSGAHTPVLTITDVHPSRAGRYSVVVSNPDGNTTSSEALLSVIQLSPLGEALDATQYSWSNGGNAPWVGQPVVTHDGIDAARSGNIGHSQTTSFQTTVNGPGTVTFWWKVSCEPSDDRLQFLVNGSEQARISGEIEWEQRSFTINSGSQTLTWRYSKDSSTSAGQDRAWVDGIRVIPQPVIISTHPASDVFDQGSTATLSVTASGTPPLSYQWSYNGQPIAGATSATLVITNIQPEHAGNYRVTVGNALGVVNSANAKLEVSRIVPLAEALDAQDLTWTLGGSLPQWVGQTLVTKDGIDAARSGRIGHSANTYFRTTVTGPGTITFWWKVSSEFDKDELRFYMDGSEREAISGEVDWTWRSWPVSSGSHTLEWRYVKGSSNSDGQDSGWVDEVRYTSSSTSAPPFIAVQPENRTAVTPATVSFRALAGGTSPLSYSWYHNGVRLTNDSNVSGANTTNLTVAGAGAGRAGSYYVVVTNAAGTATSMVATLTMITAPEITRQPISQNVVAGSTVNLNLAAIGMAPLSYEWLFNGSQLASGGNISGVNSTNLRLTSVTSEQEGDYSVVVSNAAGVAVSAPVMLRVSTRPAITSQPTNVTATAGTVVTIRASASGTAPLGYQWRLNGTNLADDVSTGGTTTSVLTLNNVQASEAGVYSVVVTNAVGSVTSSNATLTVLIPPRMVNQPDSQQVNEGSTVTFTASATGTAPLTYRWYRNGTALVNGGSVSGATSAALTLNNAQPAQAGEYWLEVRNAAGVITSSSAHLDVIAAMTLGEAVNAPYLTWTTDLKSPWTVQTNTTHDGEASVRSGSVTNGETTWIETTVSGPGTLLFWWRTSSQTNADVLTFSVAGGTWATLSGETGWIKVTTNLPPGPVVLRWAYTKDATVNAFSDRAWLDEVDFVPTTGPSLPTIVQQPAGQSVEPGATVTFSVTALGTAPLSYQWRYNGAAIGDGETVIGSRSPTLTLFNAQGASSGVYDVIVRNPYSLAQSEPAYLSVVTAIPLATAVDTERTNLVWLTGGSSPWLGQPDVNADRIDAAQSGPLLHSQSNWIQTIVTGPGAITFWWKVSSETNRDRLRFVVDGVEQANISGEMDWRQRTFYVPNTLSVLRWVYTKDGSGSAGLDRSWVDMVTFGPSAPIITNFGPDEVIVDQGTTVRLSVDAGGTRPFSYQWQHNGANLVDSDTNLSEPGMVYGATGNHRLTISNAQPHQTGIYVAEVVNSAGVAVSAPMVVRVDPAPPVSQALNSGLAWETGGYSWWVGTTNVTHDGVMSARNGTLPNSRSTWMRTTVTGPGTLRFWWKASTETNNDHVVFTINGVEQARISGNRNWHQKVYDLNEIGTPYLLQWEYSKNSLLTNGLDQVWVDEVAFEPIVPIVTNQPTPFTSVDAGSTVTFDVGVRGTPPLLYQWNLNGQPLTEGGNVMGAGAAVLQITNVQVEQAGRYAVMVGNVAGSTVSADAWLEVIPIFPIGDALEAPNLDWSSTSPRWVGQPVVTHDGMDSARSPVLGNSQSAVMQTTLAGPGTFSFWWKVSSETNKDHLIFHVDNSEQAKISGERDWHQRSFNLASGTHTLKWTYAKNSSGVAGLDRGWVDEFVFIPVAPAITTHPASTIADQGGSASFSVAASGTPPFAYEWRHNGARVVDGPGITGSGTATLTLSDLTTTAAGSYSVLVRNAAGEVTSGVASLSVVPTVSLQAALDEPTFTWSTSGTAAWIGQTVVAHDGSDSARAGGLPHGSSGSIQTTLVGPGTVSFWWKVSSETNNDRLIFYTNNTEAARISGEVDWRMRTHSFGPGTHTLRWTYSKNSSVSAGEDRAWVDQVVFGPMAPVITTQPINQDVDLGGTARFSVAVAGTPPFSFQWQYEGYDLAEGNGITGTTSSNLVLTGVDFWHAGDYRVLISGGGGGAVSETAELAVFPMLDLTQSLDGTGLVWATDAGAPWVGHGAVTHDGVDAGRSGNIGHSSNTWLTTSVVGPGSISFWWKVSSETNRDYLTFFIDGEEEERISGEVNWQFRTFDLGAGSHALRWVYSKGSSGTAGMDRGWIDLVRFGPVPPTITSQPSNQAADEGATASFTVAVTGTPPLTYQWQHNGNNLLDGGNISGTSTTNLVINGAQRSNAGTYRAVIIGSAGTAISTGAVLTVHPILPLADALDVPGQPWTTNGSRPWVGHGAVTHDGVDAARIAGMPHGTSSSVSTVFNGAGTLHFWWKVSSEPNNDRLVFYTNEVEAARISGEVDWQVRVFELPPGSNTVRWTYTKSSSASAGQDRAWLDEVRFGVVPPVILSQPSATIADPGGTAQFSVSASATPPLSYQWLFNHAPLVDGAGISGSTTRTLTISNAQVGRVGFYSVLVGNSVGSVTSSPATLTLSANVTLEQALDGGLTFTSGGTGEKWKGQQTITKDGLDAAETGPVGNSTYTWIKTTVTGPGPLTFWWRVSSEADHDYLRFMVDAVDQAKISGETDWQQVTYAVPAGTHELQWRYSKNSSVAAGQDRGWVDQILFGTNPPTLYDPPTILIHPVSKTVESGETISFSVAASSAYPLTYSWYWNSTNRLQDGGWVSGAATSTLMLHNTSPALEGHYTVVVSNTGGGTVSSPARLTVLPSIDLAEAVDSLDLFITTDGEAFWTGQTVSSQDGLDAARSGRIDHSQLSVIRTMVPGPGVLSFWWKVSSQTNADYLTFLINGTPHSEISGEVNWQHRTVLLPDGPQILEWVYAKDGGGSAGDDRSWLDRVAFNDDSTVTNTPPTGAMSVRLRMEDGKAKLTWMAHASKTYKVFYKDALSDPEWTLYDGEVLLTWVVGGTAVPEWVFATVEDNIAGPTRFYRVMEY